MQLNDKVSDRSTVADAAPTCSDLSVETCEANLRSDWNGESQSSIADAQKAPRREGKHTGLGPMQIIKSSTKSYAKERMNEASLNTSAVVPPSQKLMINVARIRIMHEEKTTDPCSKFNAPTP